MSQLTYRSSQPDQWTMPRPFRDASLRRMKHGPVQPLASPRLLDRLLRRA